MTFSLNRVGLVRAVYSERLNQMKVSAKSQYPTGCLFN